MVEAEESMEITVEVTTPVITESPPVVKTDSLAPPPATSRPLSVSGLPNLPDPDVAGAAHSSVDSVAEAREQRRQAKMNELFGKQKLLLSPADNNNSVASMLSNAASSASANAESIYYDALRGYLGTYPHEENVLDHEGDQEGTSHSLPPPVHEQLLKIVKKSLGKSTDDVVSVEVSSLFALLQPIEAKKTRKEAPRARSNSDVGVSARSPTSANAGSDRSLEQFTALSMEDKVAQCCLTAVGGKGATLLHLLALTNKAKSLQQLLKKCSGSIVINTQDRLGRSPLMLAAMNGHGSAARVLLQAQADVQITDTRGKTAMVYASTNGHSALTMDLVRALAITNLNNNNKQSVM